MGWSTGLASTLQRMKPRPQFGGFSGFDMDDETVEPMPARLPMAIPYADPRETIARMRTPETIEPTGNSDFRRMPQADITGDYRRAAFADPEMRPFAQRELGVTDSQSQALNKQIRVPVDPGPTQVKRGGILGTLGHIGKSALMGFAAGSQHGAAGGLGGAIAGAFGGGITPQGASDARYRLFQQPQYQRDAAFADKELGAQEDLARDIGRRTGFDPMTGQELPEMEMRRQDQELRRMQMEGAQQGREWANEDRGLNRQDRAQASKERMAAVAVQRAAMLGQPVPEDAVAGTSMEAFKGMVPPPKTQTPSWHQDDQGNWVDLNAQGGPRNSGVRGRVPGEMTEAQRMSEARGERREDRADQREERAATRDEERRSREAEVALGSAQRSINAARQMSAHPQATPEQKQQAWDDAAAAVEQAMTSHPEMLEGGADVGEGKYPYIKWLGGKKPSASAGRKQQGISQSEYQQQVQKYGQQKVDEWLRSKGISVQ